MHVFASLLLLLPALVTAQDCKTSDLGDDYIGTLSVTSDGIECQRWDEQSPHEHVNNNPEQFPEGDASLAENFCRNPDAADGGPWCYTVDPDNRWQYCDIPLCEEEGVPADAPSIELEVALECRETDMGKEYMGMVSVTNENIPCQRWDEQAPHEHVNNNPDQFPEGDASAAENYCRNPDDAEGGPWCYTTDPDNRWQYCDIPYCGEGIPVVECRQTELGLEYMGSVAQTSDGIDCQRWDEQAPHEHVNNNPDQFPERDASLAENFCRNPDAADGGPWCYTVDPDNRWQYCDVPVCGDDAAETSAECWSAPYGVDYLGTNSTTISGRTCQRWDSQSPHEHIRTNQPPYMFLEQDISDAENYCRNPDGELWPPGLWCYTTDPDVRWEPCNIPSC